MSPRPMPPQAWEDWWDQPIQPGGHATTISFYPDQPLPKREFPPGFHGANPGPSHPEPKPRYRVKARSVRCAT